MSSVIELEDPVNGWIWWHCGFKFDTVAEAADFLLTDVFNIDKDSAWQADHQIATYVYEKQDDGGQRLWHRALGGKEMPLFEHDEGKPHYLEALRQYMINGAVLYLDWCDRAPLVCRLRTLPVALCEFASNLPNECGNSWYEPSSFENFIRFCTSADANKYCFFEHGSQEICNEVSKMYPHMKILNDDDLSAADLSGIGSFIHCSANCSLTDAQVTTLYDNSYEGFHKSTVMGEGD